VIRDKKFCSECLKLRMGLYFGGCEVVLFPMRLISNSIQIDKYVLLVDKRLVRAV